MHTHRQQRKDELTPHGLYTPHMPAHTCTQHTTVCIPLTPHAHMSCTLYVHPRTYALYAHIHTDNTNMHAQEYTLCMHIYMPTHAHSYVHPHIDSTPHAHTHTTLWVCILIHTQCTHARTLIHMHILNAHPNVHTPIVSIYTFIHTYTAHIEATHTCTHSTPSTLYVHIHMDLHSTLTHYEHAQAYTHTQPGGGTLHRPTACRHFTHSSQYLSCAVQTLRDPCPFSTCSSESHRAAVSGVCKGSIPAAGVEIGGVQTRMVGSSLASGLLRISRGPSCTGRTDRGVSGAWRDGEDPNNRGSFLNMSTV